MEHEEKADEMEHDAEDMEEQSERVGDHIDDTRRDWESKEQDQSVPGAQPDPEDGEESASEEDES